MYKSMRRISAILLVSLLISFSVSPNIFAKKGDSKGSNQIVIPIPIQDISLETDKDGYAVFSDCTTNSIPGEPAIPIQKISAILPPDVDFGSVTVEMQGDEYTDVPGSWDVRANGPLVPADNEKKEFWPEGKTIENGKDAAIYNADKFYPNSTIIQSKTGQLHEWKMDDITISPYLYNPVSKSLRKLSAGNIVINYRLKASDKKYTKKPGKDLLKSRADKMVAEGAANYNEMAAQYIDDAAPSQSMTSTLRGAASSSQLGVGYVILTTNDIKNNSTKLNAFVADKQNKGFDVYVVTESDWGGGTGDTAANNIRAWLQSNYESLSLRYALLIGNPNPATGTVPMKMACAYGPYRDLTLDEYQPIPTDFFYSEMSGNWDVDADGKFGEYEDDYGDGGADCYGELTVGRIPYYGTMNDLDVILQKTIDAGTITPSKDVLLAGKPITPTDVGYTTLEEVKNDILIPAGYGYQRVYDSYVPNDPNTNITVPCTQTNVRDQWNGISPGLVAWSTHGWPQGASDIMDITTASTLDDWYSFTFQASCWTAYPEATDNLAYKLLLSGAINTLGATRISWSLFNNWLLYDYSKNLILDGLTTGDSLNNAYRGYGKFACNGDFPWAMMLMYNIYGDPSLALEYSVTGITPVYEYVDLPNIGDSVALSASVIPSNVPDEDKLIYWSSSDPAVAAVDSTGNVTAVSPGQATITATTAVGGYTTSCTVCVGGNLLKNPGFEKEDSSPWTFNQPQFSVTTEQKRSGTHSVKLAGTASWGYLGQVVNVIPNTDYTWTVYMKSSGASGARLRVLRTAAQGGGMLPGTTAVDNVGGNVWTPYTINFNSGSCTELTLSVSDSQKNRTHYIDDFDLRLKDWPTPEPLSRDAKLSALTYQSGYGSTAAVTGFSATDEGGTYTVKLWEGATSVNVGATAADPNATVQMTPENGTLDLSSGSGTATVVVRAEDGITLNTYTIKFLVANNLLANPGFETGVFTPWISPQDHFSLTSQQAHSGMLSVVLTSSGSWTYLGQTVNVIPYTDYTWTVWMKSSAANGARMRILRTAADGGGILPGSGFVNNTGGFVWTQYTLNFNSGSYSQLVPSISDSYPGRTHYIDDSDLRIAGAPEPPPLSDDARLSSIVFQTAGLTELNQEWFGEENQGETRITEVSGLTTTVTVEAIKSDPNATVQMMPANGVVDVSSGNGTITITVTAQDGVKVNTYVVHFRLSSQIANHSFETGDFSAWTASDVFSVTTEQKHLWGFYSAKLTGNSGWTGLRQDAYLLPHTDYIWRVYGKSGYIPANFYIYTTDGVLIKDCGPTSWSPDEWKEYTFAFNSGDNNILRFVVKDSWGGTHYFDDFICCQVLIAP